MKTLLNIFLFPKGLYQRITDKKMLLYLGIIFIGILDVAFPNMIINFKELFMDKPLNIQIYNIILAILCVLVIGALDVIVFAIPLSDLFKFLGKQSESPIKGNINIKVMKIYIIAHIILLPMNFLFYFLFPEGSLESNIRLVWVAFYIQIFVLVWFSAVIQRGVTVVCGFERTFKRLTFFAVLLWNLIWGQVLSYAIVNWVMKLFM